MPNLDKLHISKRALNLPGRNLSIRGTVVITRPTATLS